MSNSEISSEIKMDNSPTTAIVKVGKNEVEVILLEVFDTEWLVQSVKSGKNFRVKKLERIIPTPTAPIKKMSLIDAAYEVLKSSEFPLNTKEMVAKAIEAGLWIPTSCKTLEQTLYGSIFREIKEASAPRFSKSCTRKGAFVVVG